MSTKFSLKKGNATFIGILAVIILVLSILYITERNKHAYANENLEKTNMLVYDLEVKSPLVVISYFLGQQPVEAINWSDQSLMNDLEVMFRDLDYRLMNIETSESEVFPESILQQVDQMHEHIQPLFENLSREEPLTEATKIEIVNLSQSIFNCEISEHTSSWEQVETNLVCLNDTLRELDN
ncbi:hypothetical protein [Oceanobacillus sp. CAU 1775]